MIKNTKGFTLIEVLIAIVLLAFMMIGVYTITDNSTATKDRVLSEDAEMMQIEAGLQRFDQDFSQFYSPLYYSYPEIRDKNQRYERDDEKKHFPFSEKYPAVTNTGQPIPQFEHPDKSTLIFMTKANKRKISNAKESTYAWVQYQLQDIIEDKKENNTAAVSKKGGLKELIRFSYSTELYTPRHDWSKVNGYPILSNIKEFEFSFWDRGKQKFVTNIDHLNRTKIPIEAVKLKLVWIDKNGFENPLERVFRPLYLYYDVKNKDKPKINAPSAPKKEEEQ